MIHYRLRCEAGHEFESWFASAAGFDRQTAAGLVECPVCGAARVTRALMTPAVGRKSRKRQAEPIAEAPPQAPVQPTSPEKMAAGPMPAQLVALLQRMRGEVEKNCDYVGGGFADEARRIHNGEVQTRGIYGEATEAEREALSDEGIEVGRIPWIPRADG